MYTIQGYQDSKFSYKGKVIKVRKTEEEMAKNNAWKIQELCKKIERYAVFMICLKCHKMFDSS